MRLSKKGEYAVRALVEICQQVEHSDHTLLQIAFIAEKTNIPEKFLEQILLTLKNGGILKSKRGVDGGYAMNKASHAVTLGEVIRLMDGPLAPVSCVSKSAYESCTCPDERTCGLHIAMQQVRDAIANILDNYRLSDLVGEVKKRKTVLTGSMQFEI